MNSPSTISNSNHFGPGSHKGPASERTYDCGEVAVSKKGGPAKILLVSNQVMHYRVSVYNYFHRRFRELGFEFSVIADCLQKQNKRPLEFEFCELPFNFL